MDDKIPYKSLLSHDVYCIHSHEIQYLGKYILMHIYIVLSIWYNDSSVSWPSMWELRTFCNCEGHLLDKEGSIGVILVSLFGVWP